MALFHFLGNILHGDQNPGGGVFGFLRQTASEPINVTKLGTATATGNQQAQENAFNQVKAPIRSLVNTDKHILHFATQTGQSILGSGIQLGTSLYNLAAPHVGLPEQSFNPNQFGTAGSTLLGNKPIESIQAGYSKSRQAGHGIPLSAGLAGLTTFSDLPLFPGSKNVVGDLIKASTAQDAEKLLVKNGIDAGIAHGIAPGIAQTKDPNIIKNIIDKAHTPPPSPEIPVVGNEVAGQGSAPNKFLQTIQNAQSTGPELQEAIKGLKQTHEIRSTDKLAEEARKTVESDYTGSLTKVLTTDNPSDKDIAMGQHLIVKAQQEGRIGEAVNIAEQLDNKLREAGRSVQAATIMNRLSPEGQLLLATKKIRQVREANPKNIAREKKTAEEIQQTLESSVPAFNRESVGKAVQDIANGQQKLDLGGLEGGTQAAENVGQKLAKGVEAAALPPVQKKVDTLVQELTKKVKQEYLEPKTVIKKPPLQILQEVFGRNAEAQEAYPLAQKILREKYADVPQMQEALDKFFGSKLNLPAAESTIGRAIQDQLKSRGERVSDIIYKSLTTQEATIKNVASDLVKEGFDQQSATKLSEEVAKRLNKEVSDAKSAALEILGQEAKPRNQSTFLDKINKFSNLGALDKEDYLQLARAKLNLPHLRAETAGKISELSQKIQELPEGHDKYAAVREIQHLIVKEIPKSKWQLAKEFAGLPRTILASGDFSFGGRQGLVYATSHPIEFAKAWPKQFKYFKEAFGGKDSEAYDAMMADVRSHPNYPYLEKYGRLLDPTGHDVRLRNEQFLSSDIAEKIPLLRRLVRGSNYAFTGLHNTLYANQFYGMLEHLQYAGVKGELLDDQLKKTAEVISTSLGRGGKSGGFVEKHGGFFSTVLFAPRLIASRLNVMNPVYYLRLDGPARQEALRGLMGLSAFAVSSLKLAQIAGAKVSLDPRNADFGKIRVGDTRFDVLGGFTQYIRLGTQITTGQKINSTTGAQTEVGKGFTGSRLDIASNFIQGKENPSVSFVTDLLKGQDINGNSLYSFKGVGKETLQRFIPLLAQDLNDLRTHPNSAGIGAVVPGLFGTGIQTYGKQDLPITDKQKSTIKLLQQKGASTEQTASYKDFYQTIKGGPPRTNRSEDINKALAVGDEQQALQIAQDYNKKVLDGIKPWLDAHRGQPLPPELIKDLKSALIDLNSNSIRSRLQSIVENPDKYKLKIGGQ